MLKSIQEKARHVLYQGTALLAPGTGIEQSPLLSKLFAPTTDLATFFNTLFKTAIIVGAMFAVLRLGYAGFVYMTTDLWPQKQTSSRIIQDTVLGLLLLLGIWIILYQINPNLLKLDILKNIRTQPARLSPMPARSTNGFTSGAGNPDPSLNGAGVSGTGDQSDQFAPGLF